VARFRGPWISGNEGHTDTGVDRARPGRWLLDEGEPTDQSDAEMAAELVREQMFRYLHQEVPYALQVRRV
jgi:GTPase Era involved in 16S rRNA processing